MKMLISVILALVLSLAFIPAAAEEEAAAPVSTLYVEGVNALETSSGDGWSFDASTGVLTLNNCTLTESVVHKIEYVYDDYTEYDLVDTVIYFEGDLTIELVGTNCVERAINEAPTDYTQYSAIFAGIYPKTVDGENWDMPSKLSIKGSGNLTAGIAISRDCLDADGYNAWEYLEFSCGIFCNAEDGVDLTGLCDGGWLDVYGGVQDYDAYWKVKAWNASPTFGSNAVITAYQDLEGSIENENGYNWNNNDAWRMKVVTADAFLNAKGLLTLLDSGSASGDGWIWENKVLTLSSGTAVKAVEFRQALGGAKLALAGDVTLDSTGMGYDANWNSIPCVGNSCDLQIDAGSYTLTFAGEHDAIVSTCADVLISGGTLENISEYDGRIYINGGSLTIKNATVRSNNDIYVAEGWDSDWNTVPGGDILIDNAVVTLSSSITGYSKILVLKSELTITQTYCALSAPDEIFLQDSDIMLTSFGTALDTNGAVSIDNCNLNITTDGAAISCGYVYGGLEADLSKLSLTNMNITEPAGYRVIAEANNWGGFSVKLANSDGTIATTIIATAAIEDDGCTHNYQNGICAECGMLKSYYWVLSADVSVNLILEEDLYVDLNGWNICGIIISNGHEVYGMDSTTDSYSCEAIGYFNCVNENGTAFVPTAHFKSDITGQMKRYMSIKDENGYSFHRFYLGITHINLNPTVTGVGYKAVFYGDSMVKAQLDAVEAFGYTLQVGTHAQKTVYKDRNSFVSGKAITLRVNNFDVENYGEVPFYATVMLKLSDGTVIESAQLSMTMRSMLETINGNYTALTAQQLTAVKAMIEKYAIIKDWDIGNLSA